MLGPESSVLFRQHLISRFPHPFRWLFQDMLSIGSISYYMNSDDGWMTRLFVHNYFALLGDGPCPADWEVIFYDRDGRKVTSKKGKFVGNAETVVLELKDIPGLDIYGIAHLHIRPRVSGFICKAQYGTTFYSEYYVPGTKKSVIAHSLNGSPKATHAPYGLISTSWIVPPQFVPYLFIAGGCNFHSFHHSPCARGTIYVTNDSGEKKSFALEPFGPRECKKINLFSVYPEFKDHIKDRPFMIEIDGANLMPRPFLFLTDGNRVLAEHL